MKPHRLDKTKRRTMLRCWPTPRLTPTAASVPTAANACESRCPFGVKIAERMKKTAELFGC